MNTPAEPANNGQVDCSVLVPVLNEERYIVETVAAMRRQRFDGTLEFLLADGGSTDRTRELLSELQRQDPRVRVFENPRRGTPSGLNVALAHARGRYVARMDAHTTYPDDYVAQGVRRLARGDTRWVSGPPIATGDTPISRAVALALRTSLGRGASKKWANERDGDEEGYELDSGVFAGVWERQTVLEFNGWDERWLRNQDSEMAGRFLERSERLICLPAMASEYTPRNTVGSLWRQYLEYGEYREWTAVRHPATMRRSHLLAPSLVACIVTAVAAPRPLRRLARSGLVVYAVTILGAGMGARQDAIKPGDALLVPLVLATMHVAHGAGSWRGALRHGVPVAAVASALGLEGLAARFAPAPEPVFSPSLVAPQGAR